MVLVARFWRWVFDCVSLVGVCFYKFGGGFWLCESGEIVLVT